MLPERVCCKVHKKQAEQKYDRRMCILLEAQSRFLSAARGLKALHA